MAILIKSNGTNVAVEPENGSYFSLRELKAYVGGHIEIVHMPHNSIIVVCNEDGRLLHLPTNFMATLLTGIDFVGDVLICKDKQVK